jgi:hypothetical protein
MNVNNTPNSSRTVGIILTLIIVLASVVIAVIHPVQLWGQVKSWPLILGPVVMGVTSYLQKDNNQNGYTMAIVFALSFIIVSASLWI